MSIFGSRGINKALTAGFIVTLAFAQSSRAEQSFNPMEQTIGGIHAALKSRKTTCVAVIQSYLARIDAYDQKGPVLNSIQNVNPQALDEAAAVDRQLAAGAPLKKLSCIPTVVKDQIETKFLPTTYGSVLFKTFQSERNAAVVDRLLDAGAIIVGKTNLGEFAAGGSGSAFGDCHNAYNPLYYASGSSCGTGVAIAANFAVIGIGEDTAGSLRGPASHGSLYGLRPTTGLISLYGVMPQAPTRDTLGPISRTVEDAAIVMDVIAGYDKRDARTARAVGNVPKTYTTALGSKSIAGLRFGIIRSPLTNGTDTAAADYMEIRGMVTKTAEGLKQAGASIVDNVESPGLLQLVLAANYGGETEDATDLYLAQLKNPPFTTWASIVVDPRITPSRQSIKNNLGQHPKTDPKFAEAMRVRNELRDLILQVMAENELDGLIYAPFDRAPPKLPGQTAGSNRLMSTFIGFPSIVVPAGLNSEGLPIGVEIMSRPWTEALLLHTAYAYDKLAKPRVVPSTVPPL